MTIAAGRPDVSLVDRAVNAARRLIEATLPWYDRAESNRRRVETQRVRRRSIAARIAVEDIARRYERTDGVLRR